MIFDNGYCTVDGNPCEQGSTYCSDECREYDLEENQNVFFNGGENEDPLESLTEDTTMYNSPTSIQQNDEFGSPNYLLYECCFCKSTHNANAPCTHNLNYLLEPKFLDLTSRSSSIVSALEDYFFYHEQEPASSISSTDTPSSIFEALQSFPRADADFSIAKSNLSIQHNYRKWLIMGSA